MSLAFTPTVLADGVVSLVVAPEVSSIDPSASIIINNLRIPGIQTRRAKTTVELRDGESFAMAGLIRKDFPQRLGVFIVIIAAVAFLALASSRQHFYLGVYVLLAAAIIDAALYWFVPKITVCYRCRAEFRDVPVNPEHEGFELAIGEKYRAVKDVNDMKEKP